MFLTDPTPSLGGGNGSIPALRDGFPGSYGQIDIGWTDPTHATVAFASEVRGGWTYLVGGVGSLGLSVNAVSFAVGPIAGGNSGAGFVNFPDDYSVGSGQVVSGFGEFNLVVTTFSTDVTGWLHAVDFLSFEITNTGGTWAAESDVLADNAAGYQAAAHILVANDPASYATGPRARGWAGSDGPVSPTPEPASWVLALIGAVGLAAIGRRFRKAG